MSETSSSYSVDAVQAVRTAAQIQYQLSAMADTKASLLMGASFVVFTISVARVSAGGELPVALMILGLAAFLAAMCAAAAVMPAFGDGREGGIGHGKRRNLMFFGGFDDMSEDDYVAEMMRRLADQDAFLEMMARDVWQNGQLLARKKYRLLRWAYVIFIGGLLASLAAFLVTGLSRGG